MTDPIKENHLKQLGMAWRIPADLPCLAAVSILNKHLPDKLVKMNGNMIDWRWLRWEIKVLRTRKRRRL